MEHKRNKHNQIFLDFVILVCTQTILQMRVFLFKNLVGSLFNKNIVVFAASAHNLFGNSFSWSIHLVISMMLLFFLSLTPFYCGVYDTISWCSVPVSSQNLSKISLMYFFPLSCLIICNLQPLWFSTNALYF